MNRSEILAAANDCVSNTRAATYGDASKVYALAAELGAAFAHHRGMADAHSELIRMALMKIARIAYSPAHLDNYIDACGYLALAAESIPKTER